MLLIDDLLLSPISGFKFILRTLARAAEEQYTDDAPIKERLLELQTLLEEGSITEEEYVEQEREVLVDPGAGSVGQLDVDEDVFAGRGVEHVVELLRVDLDRARTDGAVLGLAVKHARDAAGLAHGLDGGAADAGALGYLEGDGLGHKMGEIAG